MTDCGKCKKSKEFSSFIDIKGKQYKTCFDCREISRIWREKNKETVSLYNKNYNEKKLDDMLEKLILAMNAKNLTHK